MVTPTGIESGRFQGFTGLDGAPGSPAQGGTQRDAAAPQGSTSPDAAPRAEVVTARGAYLEAVARLAAEATARGDIEAARALLRAAEAVARKSESDT
jgi:hypothetical protein